MTEVTRRFDGRADDYDRARPRYPKAAIDHIRRVAKLAKSVVVDLGAGTGLSTIGFVDAGDRAILVEPNPAMAALARERFEDRAVVIEARAEATTLDDHVAALVIAAQAFHWFDPDAVAEETRRILAPDGAVALFWNERRLVGTPFLEAYDAFLLEWGTDYEAVRKTYQSQEAMHAMFGGPPPDPVHFENRQALDREGLRRRIGSCSYIPGPEHPRFEAMSSAIDALFDTHADGGVELIYDTTVYAARLNAPR